MIWSLDLAEKLFSVKRMVNRRADSSSGLVWVGLPLAYPSEVACRQLDQLTLVASILADINHTTAIKFTALKPQALDRDREALSDLTALKA